MRDVFDMPMTLGFRLWMGELWTGRPCGTRGEMVAARTVYMPKRTKIVERAEWEEWHPTGLDGD